MPPLCDIPFGLSRLAHQMVSDSSPGWPTLHLLIEVRLYRKVSEEYDSDMLGVDSFHLFAVLDALDRPHALAMPPAANVGQFVSAALSSNSVRTWKPSANLGRNGPEWFDLDCSKEIGADFGHKFAVRGASISPDGNSFVASSYQGHICVWERQGNTWNVSAVFDFPQHPDYNHESRRRPAREVRFSPSGDSFVAGDDAGGIHGWQRTSSGWDAVGSRYSTQAEEYFRVIAWSWDEKWVASGGTASRVWNIDNKESELQELQDGDSAVHSGKLLDIVTILQRIENNGVFLCCFCCEMM